MAAREIFHFDFWLTETEGKMANYAENISQICVIIEVFNHIKYKIICELDKKQLRSLVPTVLWLGFDQLWIHAMHMCIN